MKLRCLWVSGYVPDPPESGMMVYSAHLSRALARAGASVTGLGLERPDGGPQTADVQWSAVRARRRGALAGVLNPLPFTAFSHGAPALRKAFVRTLAERPWDVVVIDHLQSGWVLPLIARAKQRPRVVYLAHNYETAVRADVADREARRSARGAVLRLDAAKIARLERRLVQRADVVTAITDVDAEAFRSAGAKRVVTIVPGWTGRAVEARTITAAVPRAAAVLGHWEWHVKQANLERFLAVADPVFAAAGAEIVVLGPAPAAWVAGLSERLKATRFLGWVDDLGEELGRCRLGIVAEPAGGGFKLKSLDYAFSRLPIAALDGSISGLPVAPDDDVIIRSDEPALAHAAAEALDDLELLNRLQERTFSACAPLRGWDAQGVALHAAISA